MKEEVSEFKVEEWLSKLAWPKKDSHKGQNGRVLVIGGSSLFHAAPFWAANAASRIVDMVHFSSPYLLNNRLVEEKAKRGFWNGIVVSWKEVEKYIEEDDVVLIGPGMMRRNKAISGRNDRSDLKSVSNLSDDTKGIVRYLLRKYPEKKWVVDGGALQEVELGWLNERMIVTPNQKELEILVHRLPFSVHRMDRLEMVKKIVEETGATVVAKGVVDLVVGHNVKEDFFHIMEVGGGDPGMTKGGTGDVLAGIIAGLYATNEAIVAGVVGSYVNKKIGEKLGKEQVWFNASDMISGLELEINALDYSHNQQEV